MFFNQNQRNRFIKLARQKMKETWEAFPSGKGPIGHYCLFWADTLATILRNAGVQKAQIQAGTAYWPIIRPEEDDGVSHNQWGYKFELSQDTLKALKEGRLPEMHAWVAIPGSQPEIIDITTCFWHGRVMELGYPWTAP